MSKPSKDRPNYEEPWYVYWAFGVLLFLGGVVIAFGLADMVAEAWFS